MRKLTKKAQSTKAQSTLEYALIISVCVAALLTMQVYIGRSMQGKLKDVADELSQEHYAAGKTTGTVTERALSDVMIETNSTLNEEGDVPKIVTTSRTTIKQEDQTRTGNETFEE